MQDIKFHLFEDVADMEGALERPCRFTYPFNYVPHPLSVAAAERTMRYIEANVAELAADGKMFGVLVAEDGHGQIGFLAAYSGLLGARNDHPFFVPAVYDMMQPDGYFKVHEREISDINGKVCELEDSPEYAELRSLLCSTQAEAEEEIGRYKKLMEESKRRRDAIRGGVQSCSGDPCAGQTALEGDIMVQLLRESQFQKAELRRIRKRCQQRIDGISHAVNEYTSRISELKKQRQMLSDALQKWLFAQFRMLNACGQVRDLNEIFEWYSENYAGGNALKAIPPAGSGECCAPKLLQYAFVHRYKPLCMAEFWWGSSPKGEIRQHGHYYPSCQGKCKPILTFMLQGMDVDPDPLACKASVSDDTCENVSGDKCCCSVKVDNGMPETVYEDEDIIVVNKPAGMLSVPGKDGSAVSVYSILSGIVEEPLMVHRLDMDTSGLMVVAKNRAAHKHLQRQFEEHSIEKMYVALVECGELQKCGLAKGQTGRIELPLSPDYLDRPRQRVDLETGKTAITEYKVLEIMPLSEANSIFGKGMPVGMQEAASVSASASASERGSVKEGNTELCPEFHHLIASSECRPLIAFSESRPMITWPECCPLIASSECRSMIACLELRPLTGRTHQLRVHCAHQQGLGAPIVGDPLYGTPSVRMFLHAAVLTFTHPVTLERMTFKRNA